jgi:hypothetical protein
MPAWGSLSLLEGVWLLAASVGGIYSAINLLTALGDRRFVTRRKLNGGRRLVAVGNVRRESFRLSSLVSCFLVGVYAAVPVEWQAPFRGWLSPLLLLWIVGSLAMNSFLDRHDRASLMTIVGGYEAARKRLVDRADGGHAAGEHPG